MKSKTTTSPDTLAALDTETRRLHGAWTADKHRLAAHVAETARDTAGLPTARAAVIAAKVSGNAADVAACTAQLHAVQERLADAAAVEAGLTERAKQSGLRWSEAWHRWRAALEREVLGPLQARREKLAEAEAAAAREFAERSAEMPS